MAASVVQAGDLPYYIVGNKKVSYTDVTGDADYPTGGYPITAAQLRLGTITSADAQITVASNADDALQQAQFIVNANGVQGLLKLWDKTPAEITADDDVSACVVRVIARGS
jgi:hypothetical protein